IAGPFRLGRQWGRDEEFWQGQIDDVRVWNVARSEEEISTNRFSNLTGNEAGLVGCWNFEDDIRPGRDLTSRARDGELRGGARIVDSKGIEPVIGRVLHCTGKD